MKKPLDIPPTRNHRQLAAWINANKLVDDKNRTVHATVSSFRVSTDTKIAGTRLRRPGKGRASLRLEIWLENRKTVFNDVWGNNPARLFQHDSGETYRKHSEARAWVASRLRKATA